MIVKTFPNGDLQVPRRAEGDGAVGDGVEIINPDHPDYMDWQDAIDDGRVDFEPAEMTVAAVEQHGELGPILVEKDQHFLTAREARRRRRGRN